MISRDHEPFLESVVPSVARYVISVENMAHRISAAVLEMVRSGLVSATNYQIMPGDRVFITEEPIVASTNFLARLTAPVERLFGITGLGISTVRQSQIMGRSYNQFRSG